ncbi:hypothetical protein PLEOSDRAFT_1101638 [Pleurotus ostreatus PC15]|uniref:Uncharacterized protein n=1 Tax=Pleurotus ostreatus (strain PC15) TaxID=1137138 RepID=A0A067NUF8_PLEO1|nr:hypothetical protein PLEOSDRAFT_1101638 [Pleurotus ostreatus PC15]
MPKSEIDDIFAGKGKAKAKDPTPSPSQSLPASKSSKKKNKRKSKPEVNEQPQASSSKKRPLPETIVDTSTTLGKRPKLEKRPSAKTSSSNPRDDIDRFNDSRGTSSSKLSPCWKTTEEGWAIFKEDELGINPEAGGQCPFLAPLHALGTLI